MVVEGGIKMKTDDLDFQFKIMLSIIGYMVIGFVALCAFHSCLMALPFAMAGGVMGATIAENV
jgi:hypothetical protein